MKKRLRLFILLMMVMALIFCNATWAFAADATLSVSGGGTYTKGETVTVSYTYSAASLGGGTSNVTYDASVLEYVSCSGGIAPSSASGVFSVQMGDGNNNTSLSCTLTFKAIGTGTSNISVSTSDLIDYDGNSLNYPSSSTSVTVTDPAPTVSSNANLASLYISAGSLSPSFSANTTSYTVYVDEDETVCLISAEPQDSGATIDVTGSKDLIIGQNVRSVIVTAPSGDTKTYTLTIYRGSESTSTEEDENDNKDDEKEIITTTIGDVVYEIEETIKSEDVPEEFLLLVGKFEGKDIPLVKDADLKYTLALLKDQESGDKKWFFYNEETGVFSETISLTPEELMNFVKLSAKADGTQKDEESSPKDNNVILLLILGGTVTLLAIVILILQIKILGAKNKKKKAKPTQISEEAMEETVEETQEETEETVEELSEEPYFEED
ncbi:MAG: cadherin-like beta sandwich domain-containing protein [Firmicutes bacterium]|nr:cadherin-like beta sandwich domain-containing protein [Bacillota bacterium]